MKRFPLFLTRRSSSDPLFDQVLDVFILAGFNDVDQPSSHFIHRLPKAIKGKVAATLIPLDPNFQCGMIYGIYPAGSKFFQNIPHHLDHRVGGNERRSTLVLDLM